MPLREGAAGGAPLAALLFRVLFDCCGSLLSV